MKKFLLLLILIFLSPVTSEAKETFFYFTDNIVKTPNFSLQLEDPELLKSDIRFTFDKGGSSLDLSNKDNSTNLNVICLTKEKIDTAPLPYFLSADWPQIPQNKEKFFKWLDKVKDEISNESTEAITFKVIPQQKANTGKIIITDKVKQYNNLDGENDLLCGFLYEIQKKDLSIAGAVILYKSSIYTITYFSIDGFYVFTNTLEKLTVFSAE